MSVGFQAEGATKTLALVDKGTNKENTKNSIGNAKELLYGQRNWNNCSEWNRWCKSNQLILKTI